MNDEEYKIVEEHDDPEVKTALNDLHKSLNNLQEEIRKRDQRKEMNVLTNFILSDVYAIRAKYSNGMTISDDEFDEFREIVQAFEDFTNELYQRDNDE